MWLNHIFNYVLCSLNQIIIPEDNVSPKNLNIQENKQEFNQEYEDIYNMNSNNLEDQIGYFSEILLLNRHIIKNIFSILIENSNKKMVNKCIINGFYTEEIFKNNNLIKELEKNKISKSNRAQCFNFLFKKLSPVLKIKILENIILFIQETVNTNIVLLPIYLQVSYLNSLRQSLQNEIDNFLIKKIIPEETFLQSINNIHLLKTIKYSINIPIELQQFYKKIKYSVKENELIIKIKNNVCYNYLAPSDQDIDLISASLSPDINFEFNINNKYKYIDQKNQINFIKVLHHINEPLLIITSPYKEIFERNCYKINGKINGFQKEYVVLNESENNPLSCEMIYTLCLLNSSINEIITLTSINNLNTSFDKNNKYLKFFFNKYKSDPEICVDNLLQYSANLIENFTEKKISFCDRMKKCNYT